MTEQQMKNIKRYFPEYDEPTKTKIIENIKNEVKEKGFSTIEKHVTKALKKYAPIINEDIMTELSIRLKDTKKYLVEPRNRGDVFDFKVTENNLSFKDRHPVKSEILKSLFIAFITGSASLAITYWQRGVDTQSQAQKQLEVSKQLKDLNGRVDSLKKVLIQKGVLH